MIYYKNAVQQTAQVPHIAPQNYYKFGYLRSYIAKISPMRRPVSEHYLHAAPFAALLVGL